MIGAGSHPFVAHERGYQKSAMIYKSKKDSQIQEEALCVVLLDM